MLTKTECDAARIFELETQNDRLRADNARLTAELEAARKVADAAVNYMDLDSGPDADAELWIALDDAVREYRAARPLEQRIDAALEGLTDEAKLAKNCR